MKFLPKKDINKNVDLTKLPCFQFLQQGGVIGQSTTPQTNKFLLFNPERKMFNPNQFIPEVLETNWLKDALGLIAAEESFRDKVYLDGNKVKTIGHGLTAKKYIQKGFITEPESFQAMESHINTEVLPVLKPYMDKLNNNQKVALTSYVYNVGQGNFRKSVKLREALEKGDYKEAANQMDIGYNDPNNRGLKIRRDKERALFLKDLV
jgi:lysozyme